MDGFKTLPKMAHFKEGGHAKKEMCGGGSAYRKGGSVEKEDEAQDKAMIKKAFKQHDEAEHDKEPTEIKLKSGGRSKKEKGTVRKFKDGSAVYGAKKDATDKKEIAEVKIEKPKMLKSGGRTGVSDVEKEKFKPAGDKVATIKVKPTGDKKADAPSKGSAKPAFGGSDVEKEKSKPSGDKVNMIKVKPTGDKKADAPNKATIKPSRLSDKDAIDDIDGYKTGGKIKKMQAGSLVGKLSDYVMGSSAQNAKAAKENAEYLKAKRMQQMAGKQMSPGENMAMGLAGMGQDSAPQPAPTQPAAPTPQPTAPMGAMPAQKRGGRAGKK